jgi:hypothetical protein
MQELEAVDLLSVACANHSNQSNRANPLGGSVHWILDTWGRWYMGTPGQRLGAHCRERQCVQANRYESGSTMCRMAGGFWGTEFERPLPSL